MNTIYTVTTDRSGFANQQIFRDRAAAEKFFEAEAEQIGAPVRLTEDYVPTEDEAADPKFKLPWSTLLRIRSRD